MTTISGMIWTKRKSLLFSGIDRDNAKEILTARARQVGWSEAEIELADFELGQDDIEYIEYEGGAQ